MHICDSEILLFELKSIILREYQTNRAIILGRNVTLRLVLLKTIKETKYILISVEFPLFYPPNSTLKCSSHLPQFNWGEMFISDLPPIVPLNCFSFSLLLTSYTPRRYSDTSALTSTGKMMSDELLIFLFLHVRIFSHLTTYGHISASLQTLKELVFWHVECSCTNSDSTMNMRVHTVYITAL